MCHGAIPDRLPILSKPLDPEGSLDRIIFNSHRVYLSDLKLGNQKRETIRPIHRFRISIGKPTYSVQSNESSIVSN